jgi:hypothetical protein
VLHPPGDEDREDGVTVPDGTRHDLPVICLPRDDGDPVGDVRELLDALLPADRDDLVAPVQGVLHHVAPELAGRADDAHLRGPRHPVGSLDAGFHDDPLLRRKVSPYAVR